jgi:ankyrin repeat protein
MAAAASGNTPIVRRLLVMRELDPDIQDRDGNTALMIAIRMKQTEVAKTILNTSRARRDIKNRENEDAARIAEAKNLNEILRIIRREQDLKNGAPDIAIIADMITSDPLFRLTETLTSYPDIIRDYDASLDPYILVIKNRKPDVAVAMMELLFRNNADPNGSNDSGTRPLIESVKLKNLAYVDFFLSKRSVDVNAKDAELKTALIHAVQANDDELTIRILRRYPSKRYTIRGSDGTKVRYNACEESCKVNQTLTSVEERRENENIRRALRCGPYSCLF